MEKKYAYGRFYNIPEILEYSTVDSYSFLIQNIVKMTNCQKYLELGVNQGQTIYMIRNHVNKCVAVDMSDYLEDKNNIEFHLMSTDEFFKQNNEFFDVIFIDANHDFEYVLRDFENSLNFLSEFGIIILHDTDPMHPVMLRSGYCSDSYKIINHIYNNHIELDVVNLPICDMGLSIVKRKMETRVSKF